jgi:TetR/AcrR family transcriptional regulator
MKNDNSRETILNCALQLFSAKGYDAVSINDIVGMAGITKPTLYYFFGNKEGLFRELLKSNYDMLNASLLNNCHYEPHEEHYFEDVYPVLLKIVKAYFSFANRNSEFYLMSLALTFAPPTSDSAIMAEEYHKVQYMLIEKIFEEISAVHTNLHGKERICSWRFLAMVNAQIGFWYRGYGQLSDADAESIVKLFMHGIFS